MNKNELIFSTYIIRNELGELDLDLTMDKFRNDLNNFIESEGKKIELVAYGVDKVFENYAGSTLNLKAIISLSFAEVRNIYQLNSDEVSPMFGTWEALVRNYLANNTAYKVVVRGRNSGVTKVA